MLRIVVVTVDVFAPRRTTAIVMNSRDDVSHIAPFLNSGLNLENTLLTNVLLDPRDNREYMTQFVSETVNVPFMFVTIQTPVSLSLSGRTTGILLRCVQLSAHHRGYTGAVQQPPTVEDRSCELPDLPTTKSPWTCTCAHLHPLIIDFSSQSCRLQ